MKKTVLWFQTGACGGDTMAILCADKPGFQSVLDNYNLDLLWHPSLSTIKMGRLDLVLEGILNDEIPLDILCVEGSIVTAPSGTGFFDTYKGQSKLHIVEKLVEKANYVVAMGTCAAFGGVHAAYPNPSDCIGLQFEKTEPNGLLEEEWRSRKGLPVINVAGCPAHPNTMTRLLVMLAQDIDLSLDYLNRPEEFFNTVVHQGCTRNEYHEYDIEDKELGGLGCMFFNLGCQGPITPAICNKDLWNGRSSKTRAGVPCFGCTSPSFPKDQDLFSTEKIGDIPLNLPLGVERHKYMAYKSLAREAAPQRVKKYKMKP